LGVHAANARIAEVGNEQIAGEVERNVPRIRKFGLGGRTVVASIPPGSGTSYRGNDPVCGDFPHAIAVGFSNIKVAGGIEGDTPWAVNACLSGSSAVSIAEGASIANDCRDGAIGRDFADPVVESISNVHHAVGSACDIRGEIQLRLRCGSTVTGKTFCSVAGERCDRQAVEVDFAYAVEEAVGNQEVPPANG
jgi:hypothetical protein